MVVVKKYIFAGIIIFAVLIFILYVPEITGKNHYIISSKSERLGIINKLKKDCRSVDIAYLIVTYKEGLHDLNASHCWSNYMKKCFSEEAKKLEYKLQVPCPEY